MTQEGMNRWAEAEAARLGVGDPEFIRRHNEFMAEMEQIRQREQARKEERARVKQMLNVRDVMATLGVSESKAYGYIRQMNTELEGKGYIIVRGKVPAAYFQERFYGSK